MSLSGLAPSDNKAIVDAVRAERRACAQILWRAINRHRSAERECRQDGNDEEAEQHRWDAETLERLAEEIEKRP